jgi:hypothetical protein
LKPWQVPLPKLAIAGHHSLFVLVGGGKSDWALANRKAADFVQSDAELGQLLDKLCDRAARLVRQPRLWSAIKDLAARLAATRCVEADEAINIIESAT